MINNPPQWLREMLAKGAENLTPSDHIRFEMYLKSAMNSNLFKRKLLEGRISTLEKIVKEMK